MKCLFCGHYDHDVIDCPNGGIEWLADHSHPEATAETPAVAAVADENRWLEVAVSAGRVVINYRSAVPQGQWGNFSFTPREVQELITVLEQARKIALQTN